MGSIGVICLNYRAGGTRGVTAASLEGVLPWLKAKKELRLYLYLFMARRRIRIPFSQGN